MIYNSTPLFRPQKRKRGFSIGPRCLQIFLTLKFYQDSIPKKLGVNQEFSRSKVEVYSE